MGHKQKTALNSSHWTRENLVFREPKQGIFIRLDPEILRWFKLQGKGYQSLINAVLRSYVEAQGDDRSSADRDPGSIIRRAGELFDEFYAQCFWHLDRDLKITQNNIGIVIDGLRRYGGRRGFLLAEELCR